MRAAILFALTACGAATELDGRDAAPDVAATAIEAGPPPFCESLTLTPLFCDDFDDGTLAKWTSTSVSEGAGTTITSKVSRSAPFAMRASIPPGSEHALLVKSFPGSTGSKHVMLSFSMLASTDCFTESTEWENVVVAEITTDPNPITPPLEILFAVAGTASSLALSPPIWTGGLDRGPQVFQVAPIIEDGSWQRVVIDVNLRGDTPHLTVDTPSGTTTQPTDVFSNELDHPIIKLGPNADATHTTSCSVLFDDVIFDAR